MLPIATQGQTLVQHLGSGQISGKPLALVFLDFDFIVKVLEFLFECFFVGLQLIYLRVLLFQSIQLVFVLCRQLPKFAHLTRDLLSQHGDLGLKLHDLLVAIVLCLSQESDQPLIAFILPHHFFV